MLFFFSFVIFLSSTEGLALRHCISPSSSLLSCTREHKTPITYFPRRRKSPASHHTHHNPHHSSHTLSCFITITIFVHHHKHQVLFSDPPRPSPSRVTITAAITITLRTLPSSSLRQRSLSPSRCAFCCPSSVTANARTWERRERREGGNCFTYKLHLLSSFTYKQTELSQWCVIVYFSNPMVVVIVNKLCLVLVLFLNGRMMMMPCHNEVFYSEQGAKSRNKNKSSFYPS